MTLVVFPEELKTEYCDHQSLISLKIQFAQRLCWSLFIREIRNNFGSRPIAHVLHFVCETVASSKGFELTVSCLHDQRIDIMR